MKNYFAENFFSTFREYCKKNKIKTVNELKKTHFESYGRMNGVGVKKVELVRRKVTETLQINTDYVNINKKLIPSAPIQGSIEIRNKSKELEIQKLDHHYLTEKIKEIFPYEDFRTFWRFCMIHKLQYLSEITEEQITNYGNMRGVGVSKVEAVKKRLKEYEQANSISSIASKEEMSDSVIDLPSINFKDGEHYEVVKELDVNKLLLLYGSESDSNRNLKIKDIQGKRINDLEDKFIPAHLLDLSKRLTKQKHPKDIVSGMLAKLSERDIKLLQYRYGRNETIEKVGKRFNLSRGRVHQIAVEIIKKTSRHFKRERFATIVRILANLPSFVTKAELINQVGVKNEFMVNLLTQENLLFTHYKKMDIYFFAEVKKSTFSVIEEFHRELPEVFNFYDYQEPFEKVLDSIGIENPSIELIQCILETENYKKYGELYSRHKLKVTEVLKYLFQHYLEEPLRIDETGVSHLQALARQYLDYELEGNKRSIDARIRDNAHLLQVDISTFMYFDSENFDASVIEEIEKYLTRELVNREIINVEELLNIFQSELQKVGIENKVHLYSLLKYYLDEKFIIGQGNTLNIYKNEESKISVEEQLISFMRQNGGLCSKDQLLEAIKPLYRVDSAVSSSNQIIPWGMDKILLFENLELTLAERKLLTIFAKKSLQKGYSTASLIFDEMMYDRALSLLLKKKKIDGYNKLTGIIKVLVPNVKGTSNFLYLYGSKIDSFEKVICSHFTNQTSRKEIKEFALENGYSDRNAAEKIKKLLDKVLFVEIGLDQLYPANKFHLNKSTLEEVYAFAEKELGKNEFLSLSNLDWYEYKLPPIGFQWNAFLLKSALHLCGFRQVKKVVNDYRYDKIIVVKEESPIKTFEDLIMHELRYKYIGKSNESEIYDFLAEQGILSKQEYTHQKELPVEIKRSKHFKMELQRIKDIWIEDE